MRIILAFDSFKECMTSRQAADAAEAGIRLADPAMPVISLPGADGGEGTAECLASSFEAIPVSAKVHDPLMNNVNATYRISPASGKAFIDVAAASGLHLVPVEKRNPMVSSSYGTGELIMDAIRRGASDITICLGGSATNDGGAGMLQALGAKFHLRGAGLCGSTVIPAMFERIGHIDISPLTEILKRVRFTGAYDTDAVFTGEKGASMIYSGQKGADRKMKTDLDTCLDKLHTLYTEATGSFCRQFPASGAAGGIGGALAWILDARMFSGGELVLHYNSFDNLITRDTVVFTGEGKSDRQTLTGKFPLRVLLHAREKGVPVILLSGTVENPDELIDAGFSLVRPITPSGVDPHYALDTSVAMNNMTVAAASVLGMDLQ